jgi:hypothetical protein
MPKEILKYKILQAASTEGLTEEVNKLMMRKPDYKPQGGIIISGPEFFNVFYQAMVRPLSRGELNDMEDPYNHFW